MTIEAIKAQDNSAVLSALHPELHPQDGSQSLSVPNGDEETTKYFRLFSEDGPFSLGIASLDLGNWMRNLMKPENNSQRVEFRQHRVEYHVALMQICQLLGIKSMKEIPELLRDKQARERARLTGNRLAASVYGLDKDEIGNPRSDHEIEVYLDGLGAHANDYIEHLRGLLAPLASPRIEMSEEVRYKNSPASLLLLALNERYSPRVRFEAKRKLLLMDIAAAVEQKDTEAGLPKKYEGFIDYLGEYVFDPESQIGESTSGYLISQHDGLGDFSCLSVSPVREDEIEKAEDAVAASEFTILTGMAERNFRGSDGTIIPVYISTRPKTMESKIEKSIRKRSKNPSVTVEDDIGMMVVLPNVQAADKFIEHLARSGTRSGSLIEVEEYKNTLRGGKHTGSKASSPDTKMVKLFVKLNGIRVEVIVHTHKSLMDYLYKDDVAHDEFKIREFYDLGVADLMFPEIIYGKGVIGPRDELIAAVRQTKRAPQKIDIRRV